MYGCVESSTGMITPISYAGTVYTRLSVHSTRPQKTSPILGQHFRQPEPSSRMSGFGVKRPKKEQQAPVERADVALAQRGALGRSNSANQAAWALWLAPYS